MNEMKIGGKTFQYEKVKPEQFKTGACVFRIIDNDGDENWCVVVPKTLDEQLKGVEINSPDDGHVTAFCMAEQDALMLASSVCIAARIATFTKSGVMDKSRSEILDSKANELANKLDIDLDKLEAEVKKLKAEGKSHKEISEILKPRMEEFRKKPGSPNPDKGGEW